MNLSHRVAVGVSAATILLLGSVPVNAAPRTAPVLSVSAPRANAHGIALRKSPFVLPPAVEHEQYRFVNPRHISTDTIEAPADLREATDLDVTLIERTPRYDYDAAKSNPYVGDNVTFSGHLKNWGTIALPSVEYRWQVDGATVATGTLTNVAAGEERVVTRQWVWQAGDHWIKLTADPNNLVSEFSEVNNEIEDRTNAIIAGFWVEQSAYDYFHQYQKDLGIGSNSWPDWIQRQMRRQNQLYAEAVWPISPQGVLDRVRIDKIVVVPDGALPLNGGLPTNNPDLSDRTVDLMWGFPADQIPPNSNFYADHTTVSEDNPFYIEPSLIHELGHARYLIDSYGFDVHNTAHHGGYDAVQIWEGSVYVGGSEYMPFLAWDEVLHYNENGGVMSGPYGFHWSPYEAAALNLIAGQRAVCGNSNAPCNIGVYLQDLPQRNHIRVVDGSDQPRVLADVRIYRAESGPGWYGKTFDNTFDAEYGTDTDGYAHLPQNPFTAGGPIQHTYGIASSVMILRIEHAGQIWYRFVEAADFNLQYWQGNTQDAYYTIVLEGPNGGATHTIRGIVAGPAGLNPGVILYPSPIAGTSGPAQTGEDGSYTLTVAPGWSGSVRPERPGYTFSPSSRQYVEVGLDLIGQDYTGAEMVPEVWTLTTEATLPAVGGQAVSLATDGNALYYLEGAGTDDGEGPVGNGFWRREGAGSFTSLTSPPLERQTQDGQTIQSNLYISMGAAVLSGDVSGIWMVCHASDNQDLFGGNRDVLRYDTGLDEWSVWDNTQENTGANGIALIGNDLYVNWQGWDPISRFDVAGFPATVTVHQRAATPGNNLWPGCLVRGSGSTIWGTHAVHALPSEIELYHFDGAVGTPLREAAINGVLPPTWGDFPDGQPIGGIEFVPGSVSRSGHDEIWVLRGCGTGDLAIYDTVTLSWSTATLTDSFAITVPFQASDICLFNGTIYLVTQGGSALYSIGTGPADVGEPAAAARLRLDLPNPVTVGSEVCYRVGRAGPARIDLFDLHGRLVRHLVGESVQAGEHRTHWDGRSETGVPASSGVYFFRLTTDEGQTTIKRVLLQ